MKKIIIVALFVVIASASGMIAFSESKRPIEMNKSEKIQQNLKDAKEEAKKKAEEALMQVPQAQAT